MGMRPKYKTKQREELLGYLERLPGVHMTAADVCDYLKDQGSTIGQSTVYRQLERLVDEGLVNKYIIDSNSPACFEYVGAQEPACSGCFHCKCEACGKLIHLHCDELAAIQEHLYMEHRFRLDPLRTVFYGLCEECQKSQGTV